MAADSSAGELFLDMTETRFREAASLGLPIFLTNARQSTPLTATPYLVRYPLFRKTAAGWPGRDDLVSNVEKVLDAARAAGVAVEAMLVGGSFTELEKTAIDDIDCLIFYTMKAGAPVRIDALQNIQTAAKAKRVDARFIPLDSDPLTLLKLVSYFTILYSKHKDHNEIVRCLILVDCRNRDAP